MLLCEASDVDQLGACSGGEQDGVGGHTELALQPLLTLFGIERTS